MNNMNMERISNQAQEQELNEQADNAFQKNGVDHLHQHHHEEQRHHHHHHLAAIPVQAHQQQQQQQHHHHQELQQQQLQQQQVIESTALPTSPVRVATSHETTGSSAGGAAGATLTLRSSSTSPSLQVQAQVPSSSVIDTNAIVAFLRMEAKQAEERARSLREYADKLAAGETGAPVDFELAPLDENGVPKYKGKKRGRKPKKRKRMRNPNAPKRKHTAYTLYVQETYPQLKSRFPQPQYQSKDIIGMVAKNWKSVSIEDKEAWKERAKQESANDDDLMHSGEVDVNIGDEEDEEDDGHERGHQVHEHHPNTHAHQHSGGDVMGGNVMDVAHEGHVNGREDNGNEVGHEHVEEVVQHLVVGGTDHGSGNDISAVTVGGTGADMVVIQMDGRANPGEQGGDIRNI